MTTLPLLARLDAGDRALFSRLALDGAGAPPSRLWWLALTHLGGVTGSILLALSAALMPGGSVMLAWRALLVLGVSHAVVQLVKRRAVRVRPNVRLSWKACIAVPDRFSFPSGHACAIMAVAYVLALALPVIGWLLLPLAVVVGASRVVLGVHYPGDVLVGQAIAIVTAHLLPLVAVPLLALPMLLH
jgi:undecaprenyl-diphosphatase